jgi:hypothetical protein
MDRIHVLFSAVLAASIVPLPGQTSISSGGSAVEVRRVGETVFRYVVRKGSEPGSVSPSACYFHPITTPSGLVVTDVGPDDHPHHRGVFLAWLEVKSATSSGDFWGWGKYAPIEDRAIVHRSMGGISSSAGIASFQANNQWIAADKPLLKEAVNARFMPRKDGWVYDLGYRLTPETDLMLGKHAFSGFAVRLRKDLPLVACDSSGPVKLPSPSHLKPETDWPDRPWYAFEITVDSNRKAGIAVLSHPTNPPTLWHNVASIGLLNPCIIARGPVTLKAGEPLFLRYQVVTFDGPVPTAFLNRLAEEYSKDAVEEGAAD